MQRISKTASFKQILHNMGWQYVSFRGAFEVKKKLGLLKKRFPIHPPAVEHIQLKDWHVNQKPFFKPSLSEYSANQAEIQQAADRILRGEIKFFNSEWLHLGRSYDWVTNPDTGYRYDISSH